MKCAKARRLIRLQPNPSAFDPQLLPHLQSCAACRLYCEALADLDLILHEAAEPIRTAALPTHFRPRLHTALEAAAADYSNRPLAKVLRFIFPATPHSLRQLSNAVALASLALLVGIAASLPPTPQNAPPTSHTTHLSAFSVRTRGDGRLLASLDSCSVTLSSPTRRIQ